MSSTRGAHGGYELSRDPAEITMAEVVQALEGSLIPMQCFDELGGSRVLCNHVDDGFENCATKLLWTRVQGGIDTGARADDARRAGAVRRARAGDRPPARHSGATSLRARTGTRQLQPTGKRVNG